MIFERMHLSPTPAEDLVYSPGWKSFYFSLSKVVITGMHLACFLFLPSFLQVLSYAPVTYDYTVLITTVNRLSKLPNVVP